METLWSDVRYALRAMATHRGFTAVALLTLALGIGANTAIFSVVDAVLIRPLPYADASSLYNIWLAPTATPIDREPASLPSVRDWQRDNTVFTGIGAFAVNTYDVTGTEGTEPIRTVMGTAGLYELLGARPVLGRAPSAADDRAPVVAISHRLWMRRFGGDSTVLGRTAIMNGDPYTIIGVMPAGFHFPSPSFDAWTSLYGIYKTSGTSGVGDWVNSRGLRGYRVVARLKPGATPAGAAAAMNREQQRLGQLFPNSDRGLVVHLQSLRDATIGGVRRLLWVVLGAAGFVLLLACANVAHLALVRAAGRAREMAVRRALGAPRLRLVRQLITESVVLAAMGGVLGVLLATWGVALLVRLSPTDIPSLETVGVDGRVLLYAAAVSLLTGVLFGLAPAFAAWGGDPQRALREQGRGVAGGRAARRFRNTLIAAETALALTLLVGAGLMVRSFANLTSADTGFNPSGVLTVSAQFDLHRYTDVSSQVATTQRVLDAIRRIPGVTSAGAATSLPPSRTQQSDEFSIVGRPVPAPGQSPTAWYVPTTPGYLAALGVPLLSGRDFTSGDDARVPMVAIVNRELVRRTFPIEDPLGRQITIGGATRTIVGVSGSPTFDGVGAAPVPAVFVPYAQAPFPGIWMAIRTTGDPMTLSSPVRKAFHDVDPQMEPGVIRPMDAVLSGEFVRPRFQTWLLATFGTLAMVLAAIGIYGVVAYGVAQRTGELGLRLALGAPTHLVLTMIVRQGMSPVLVGLAAGVAGSLALSRLMVGLLYGVAPTDGATFAGVTGVLAAVAMAAAYLPARRASRVDPLVALRSD
jgi:putative ABC transport system permease protein